MIPDDNQPIIIEDTQQLPKKQIRPSTNEMFFAVLDEL